MLDLHPGESCAECRAVLQDWRPDCREYCPGDCVPCDVCGRTTEVAPGVAHAMRLDGLMVLCQRCYKVRRAAGVPS